MKNEKFIVEQISSLESFLFDDTTYLDELQQSRLDTLYEILDRDLNQEEIDTIINMRKEHMKDVTGEYIPEILNKTV